ncbi:MAG: peptidyl-prolyl cis-trans isomerase [Erythrobacter sp.]|nr:peptidyl-prolyl cis-trans isomerase [Erythrobacter sp.]
MILRRWLREPLLHFLLAGLAMFVLASWWEPRDDSGRTIHIGREDLLVFMQGRAQVYDADTFNALLDSMSADDREALIRDTALQEALYREARALNLAEADPLVRQRMVQQMRQILTDEAAGNMQVSDADVRAWFDAHQDQYALPPSISFSHVFLRAPATRAQAEGVLAQLRARHVSAAEAGDYGNRFLYQLNYADAGHDLVASHFGAGFADAVFAKHAGEWQGPVQSDHGWHLILPLRVTAGATPDFAQVADQAREDALADRRGRAAQAAMDALMQRYQIALDDGL